MTGPDRIWIDRHGGNWSPVDGGTQDVEYVRRDPAVLAALPEVQALIAEAEARGRVKGLREAADNLQSLANQLWPDGNRTELADHIRALTPTDATEALAARDRAMMAKGMREAAGVATSFLVGDPLNGIPLRNPMAHEVAAAILARAEQIEGDTK